MNVCDANTHAKCIGCGACTTVCPLDLLHISLDNGGFYKAYINDADLCVACGKCTDVCPVINEPEKARVAAFYGFARDSEDRKHGTSGGIFTAIAKHYVQNGGVVFGAVLDLGEGCVYHASSKEQAVASMSKSKYVQSNTDGVFQKIKLLLEENKDVLFCGTPCQVSGLLRSLGRKYNNLLTIDFICHGVPSIRLFQDYLLDLKKKHKDKPVSEYDFRSKANGWGRIRVSYRVNNKRIYVKGILDPFNHLFEKGLSVNPACYECTHRLMHNADITLGDFWAYKKAGLSKDFVRDGVSLYVANTEKGTEKLKSLPCLQLSQMDIKLSDYAFASRKKSSEECIRFHEDYKSNGYAFVKRKYASKLLMKSIRAKIKSVIALCSSHRR